MKRKVLQVVVTEDFLFDLKNYSKDLGMKYTELVRHILREEIYNRQTLTKRK